ncbi:hypothetical protein G1H11_22490 [Phytoactinopolyspora alkaliphila]|uniref:GAF domain-containing protein n=1 Tax=Phytoactinopolyspora alkaliphila TaxID=1783498 RepID=A0A6N9YSR0_9ACTN|nr:hypothetical protein [Phytoactinopolyspora alkaliphila]NED98071.1 hypothetical protein [Phytoactinopolyspora alkaliphila]
MGAAVHRARTASEASLALPAGVDARQRWHSIATAHESFLGSASASPSIRPVVLESWRRSSDFRVNPDASGPPVVMNDDELLRARATHPLRAAMPTVRRLLVDDASAAGVIVAVGDAHGRILWVEGNPGLLRRAEAIHVVDGAAWSEESAGTNAIGTALAENTLVQVFGSEHFVRNVHPWSCTASPIRDPRTGHTSGFVTIAGQHDVVSPQSAMLIRSVVAAVENQLRLHLAEQPAQPGTARLRTLGQEYAELTIDGQRLGLGLRHSELLLLLSLHPDGVSAGELADMMYEGDAAVVTVRAELSRLRKVWPGLLAPTRPYRLTLPVTTDAAEVADSLQRGAHRRAVELYTGPVLPRSDAPGVVAHRHHLHGWLRQVLLRHAAADALLQFARSPAGRDDIEVWQACLHRLPYGSPRRSEAKVAVNRLSKPAYPST